MEYGHAFFLYTAAIKLFDALIVLCVWFFVWDLRFQSQWLSVEKGIPDFALYRQVLYPLILSFVSAFHIVGCYRRDRIPFGFRSIKKVVEGGIVGTLLFVSALYFLGFVHVSRLYIALFSAVAILSLLLGRFFLHSLWLLSLQTFVREIRLLLVGSGELLRMYVAKLQRRLPYPIHWVGRIGPDDSVSIPGVQYLGTENELERVISQRKVDTTIVSFPTEASSFYAPILESLSHELVTVKVLPDFGKYSTFAYSADHECGIPLLLFNQPPVGTTDRCLKRILDIVVSLAVLVFFSPLFLLIAILVKATSRGPIFYSQLRIGADGRQFKMFKFRSMREDAEITTGAIWASKEDPRVTKIGKFLRQTSLDEIPQFYNVLRGDMSLVGPRPERPVFVNQFKKEVPKYMLRHKMKSGITGWAQINGWRGNTSIEERIKHDLYYIEHWSHLFDMKILVLTLFKGFKNEHAY